MEILALNRSKAKFAILFGLFTCFLSVGLQPLYAQEAKSNEPQIKLVPQKKVRRAAPLNPHWEFWVKDSSQVAELMAKNKWFQEFRGSLLFQGAMQNISPILYSLANEFGPNANTWKGRLLDHLYEKVLSGHPMRFSYYNRQGVVSPAVLSVLKLSESEIKVIDTIVSVFRTKEDVLFNEVSVTPLSIRGQKFALSRGVQCVVVGRDPQLVAHTSKSCGQVGQLKNEAELRVFLEQQFPAFAGLRGKFFAVDEILAVPMRWDRKDFRFVPSEARVGVDVAQSSFLQNTAQDKQIRLIPSSSIFFATSILPQLGSFDGVKVGEYFKENSEARRRRKPNSYSLFYAPIEVKETTAANSADDEEEGEGMASKAKSNVVTNIRRKFASALLMDFSGRGEKDVIAAAQLMRGKMAGEIFVRPVCREVLVISNEVEMIHLAEEICKKRRPSIAELRPQFHQSLVKQKFSAGFFMAPGKMLSHLVAMGWKEKNSSQALPAEIAQNQKLLEELPAYAFFGSAVRPALVMKASQ